MKKYNCICIFYVFGLAKCACLWTVGETWEPGEKATQTHETPHIFLSTFSSFWLFFISLSFLLFFFLHRCPSSLHVVLKTTCFILVSCRAWQKKMPRNSTASQIVCGICEPLKESFFFLLPEIQDIIVSQVELILQFCLQHNAILAF